MTLFLVLWIMLAVITELARQQDYEVALQDTWW